MHKSVGAVIKNGNKILMINRATFPFGWAGPAGHINEGEKPEQTLMREVKEEINLEIKDYKLLFHEFIDWNECSKGVKGHDWHVYEVSNWVGVLKCNPREVKSAKWGEINNIKQLTLEPIWRYWFEKLKIL